MRIRVENMSDGAVEREGGGGRAATGSEEPQPARRSRGRLGGADSEEPQPTRRSRLGGAAAGGTRGVRRDRRTAPPAYGMRTRPAPPGEAVQGCTVGGGTLSLRITPRQ